MFDAELLRVMYVKFCESQQPSYIRELNKSIFYSSKLCHICMWVVTREPNDKDIQHKKCILLPPLGVMKIYWKFLCKSKQNCHFNWSLHRWASTGDLKKQNSFLNKNNRFFVCRKTDRFLKNLLENQRLNEKTIYKRNWLADCVWLEIWKIFQSSVKRNKAF